MKNAIQKILNTNLICEHCKESQVDIYFANNQNITHLNKFVVPYQLGSNDTYRLCGDCANELYGDPYTTCMANDCGKTAAELAILNDERRDIFGNCAYSFNSHCHDCEEQYYAEMDALNERSERFFGMGV